MMIKPCREREKCDHRRSSPLAYPMSGFQTSGSYTSFFAFRSFSAQSDDSHQSLDWLLGTLNEKAF
jgi:hypothetical protein